MMYRKTLCAAILIAAICDPTLTTAQTQANSFATSTSITYTADLLERIRGAADTIPGNSPTAINFLKIAETHRTRAAVIQGGSDTPFVSARTVFQVLYPAASIMIDAGMDEAVHRFYGFGREEPFWPDKNETVQEALRRANLIIVTHEHGDHTGGNEPLRAATGARLLAHAGNLGRIFGVDRGAAVYHAPRRCVRTRRC